MFMYNASTKEEEQKLFEEDARSRGFLGSFNTPGTCGLSTGCNCSVTDKHKKGVLSIQMKDGKIEVVVDPTEGVLWQLKQCGVPFKHTPLFTPEFLN